MAIVPRPDRRADLDARQALYQQLAERIWKPERWAQEAAS